jgi:hypothetical protein
MSNDKAKKEMRVAQIERAIANKYSEDTVKNPESGWDEEKEKAFQEQLKNFNKKLDLNSSFEDKVEVNGVLVSKKLLNRESNRTCPVCNTYSFKSLDDTYMIKFECCFKCYVKYVEDREERWESGWRPKK